METLDKWLKFSQTKCKGYSLRSLLIEDAFAGKGGDLTKLFIGAGLIIVSGFTVLAVAATAVIGAIGSSTIAAAIGNAALILAGAAVVYSIGEALVKSALGINHKIECRNGRLWVVPRFGGGLSRQLQASWNFKDTVTKGSVGYGEFLVRKQLCKKPENLKRLNATFIEHGTRRRGKTGWKKGAIK